VRVLIVNDAVVESAVLARMLRDLGHAVVAQASNLAEALERAVAHVPDLAVVDGRLPPEGCLEAVRSLRASVPTMTVAVVAALDEIDLVRVAIASGAALALRRPLLRSQVAASLAGVFQAP
jgi:CheY-like chemotaxis protein